MPKKVRMVCAYCGSEDVHRDGPAEWDVDNQEWKLIDCYDGSSCNACGSEDCINEESIDEESEE